MEKLNSTLERIMEGGGCNRGTWRKKSGKIFRCRAEGRR